MKEVFLERVLARAEKSGLACQFTLVQEKVLSLRLANSQVIQPAATESFFAHVTLEKEGCAASSHLTGSPDWAVEAAWQKALASLSQGPKLDPLPLAPAVRQIELASAPMPEIGEFTAFAETLASSPGRSGMLQVRERQVAVVNSQGLLRTSRRQLAHFFFSQNGFFELAAPSFWELQNLPLVVRPAPDKIKELSPGSCRVLLGPRAVADLVEGIACTGFGGREYLERKSFLHKTRTVGKENFTITDDWQLTAGLPFDFQGTSRSRLPLVERGEAKRPVTDLNLAARLGTGSTGHALPPWEGGGALPLNLVLASGDEEDVFAALGEGLYLPRFHYLGLVDPATATFTGTIRDAAWVEGGRLVGKVSPARFTISFLALADRIEVLGKKRWLVPGDWGSHLVPELVADGFNIE